ncbi:MAG: proline racemase family protein [Planctomycetaceae bacterium]
MQRLQVIDTHTGGEPTRIIVGGGPDLGSGSLAKRRARMQAEFDGYRSALVNEPRGSEVMVGAILCEPSDHTCCAGVIFFNNVGYLNMCGHGTIGVAVALAHQGRIGPGQYRLQTPVGTVSFEYLGDGRVRLENVPSYRLAKAVAVEVPGEGTIRGDVAWGGNWFFLVSEHGERIELSQADRLTELCWAIRQQLLRQGIVGADGGEIDHVELFGPPINSENHSRNFVLCPGKAYDRSPCGTGTSAKLACLAADGRLQPGEVWRQESLVGSLFEGSYRLDSDGQIVPSLVGSAYVNGEVTVLLDPTDPFCWGIRI